MILKSQVVSITVDGVQIAPTDDVRRSSRLIGLAGPAGVGKSTVAQALVACSRELFYGHPAERLRFAGPLKDMLLALGLTREQVDGADKETPCDLLGGKSARIAMRTLGVEWGRTCIDPDLWVRATLKRAEQALLAGSTVVIDDVRFDNEAAAIRKLGGIVVKLQRDGVQASNVHASEAGLSPLSIYCVVCNDATPEHAARKIVALLTHRMTRP